LDWSFFLVRWRRLRHPHHGIRDPIGFALVRIIWMADCEFCLDETANRTIAQGSL
jgi:hypothetical protein